MSIYRISSNTIPDNGVFFLKDRQYSMDRVHNELSTGKKYRLPREGATDVAQGMTFHSKILKIDQYIKNINNANGEIGISENKLMDTVNVIQRVRELAVQGSNGIYSAEERKNMATEVDELLKNMVLNANSKYKDNFLFSGFKKYTKPFEVIEGAVRGADHTMIREVRYLGDNGKHLREVDRGEYVTATMPGSEIFWAEQFQIYSNVNTANFRLTNDATILVDGTKINFNAGDNIYAVMDKINRSPASINSSLDPVTGGLILKSTRPHKLELSDIEGGTLLQDLGVLQRGRPIGPNNYNIDASVFGGSIFDVMIGMRDSMISNNPEDIGGRYLGAIDFALDNLLHHTAEIGALTQRLTYLNDRMINDKEQYMTALTNVEDINVADAITELSMLDFAHKAALSSLAKLSQTSLMDFIR